MHIFSPPQQGTGCISGEQLAVLTVEEELSPRMSDLIIALYEDWLVIDPDAECPKDRSSKVAAQIRGARFVVEPGASGRCRPPPSAIGFRETILTLCSPRCAEIGRRAR